MGRYLEAVKVVLVVTLINCSMMMSTSPEQTQTSTESAKTELERKYECLKQKIATCGISDDQKECKEYEDIQLLEDTEDVLDITEAHNSLLNLAPKATSMCTPALDLYCHAERKRCTKFCYYDDEFDSYRPHVEYIRGKYGLNYDNDYNKCAEFGKDYEKCSLPEFPDHPSTSEEIKELKCLYKKVVSCGITEDNKVCKPFSSGDKSDLKEMAAKISGLSLEDIQTKYYPTHCHVKEGLHMMESLLAGSDRCSLSNGLYCTNEKQCETAHYCYEDYCKGVQKIVSASDWKEDLDYCEDIACPDISQVDEHSSLGDMKKMKCMYKKFVTCGIADNQTECRPYRLFTLEWVAIHLAGKSLGELKSTYDTDKKAKEQIKELEGWLKEGSAGICSIAEGLYCGSYTKRCSTSCEKYGDDTCKPVAKIAGTSDWKDDYDCGDSANCHGPVTTTTDGRQKSGTGRMELTNKGRAFAASLVVAVLVAPY